MRFILIDAESGHYFKDISRGCQRFDDEIEYAWTTESISEAERMKDDLEFKYPAKLEIKPLPENEEEGNSQEITPEAQ